MNDISQQDSLEQMRRCWNNLEVRIDRLEDRNRALIARLSNERATGRQDKLASYYHTLGIISVILLPVLGMILWHVGLTPMWYGIFYAVGGIVLGISNIRFSSFIRNCNYCDIPTVKAIAHARRVVKSQHRRMIVGIFFALFIVAPLFYFCFDDGNYSALIGAVAGGIIGGFIGYMMHRRKVRLARRIVNDLSDETPEI